MIDIDILRRKRGSGNGGGSGGEIYSGRSADYASEAGRAKAADRADSAATADEAVHAASAKELDGNSSVWQKSLHCHHPHSILLPNHQYLP